MEPLHRNNTTKPDLPTACEPDLPTFLTPQNKGNGAIKPHRPYGRQKNEPAVSQPPLPKGKSGFTKS
ncbi:hypothetical protein LJB99_01830 [Deltaproteobacteria bacterium OttesenSCG-928-K17]|nr:hypothetical protein [Deltaproteobacteria bacterium OttesenSCG-928-K17]